jgi:hypothetical protein
MVRWLIALSRAAALMQGSTKVRTMAAWKKTARQAAADLVERVGFEPTSR